MIINIVSFFEKLEGAIFHAGIFAIIFYEIILRRVGYEWFYKHHIQYRKICGIYNGERGTVDIRHRYGDKFVVEGMGSGRSIWSGIIEIVGRYDLKGTYDYNPGGKEGEWGEHYLQHFAGWP